MGEQPSNQQTRLSDRLRNKVALISGIGNGQGREAAIQFAREGAVVIGCDVDSSAAVEVVSQVSAAGGSISALHPIDVGVETDLVAWIDFALASHDGFDILYNNAASFRRGTIESLTRADWEATIASELFSVTSAVRLALPAFRRRGGGSVINIASIAGTPSGLGLPRNARGLIAHCVGKASVIRLTECLAIELASSNVRVNCISPGPIETEALAPYFSKEADPLLRRRFEGAGLVGRLGTAADIVAAALYLASDESSFVTGVNLVVDGGFTASGGLGRPDEVLESAVARARGL